MVWKYKRKKVNKPNNLDHVLATTMLSSLRLARLRLYTLVMVYEKSVTNGRASEGNQVSKYTCIRY